MRKRQRVSVPSSDGSRLVKAACRAFAKSTTVEVDAALLERIRAHAQQGGADKIKDVYDGLWVQWRAISSARARLCAVLIAHDLFLRSVVFRRLLCGSLTAWCEQTVGTDAANPLPEADDGAGGMLRTTALSVLRQWHERFVPAVVPLATTDYTRQLDLCFRYLRDKLHIAFAADERREADERRLEERRQQARLATAEREFGELEATIGTNLTELENALNALFPSFEERFGLEEDDVAMAMMLPDAAAAEDADEVFEDEEEAATAVAGGERIVGLTDDFVLDVAIPSRASREDQAPLVRAVKECMAQLVRGHLPKLRRWRDLLPGGDSLARVMQLLARAHALMERANKLVR
jgi:hypothetical protein